MHDLSLVLCQKLIYKLLDCLEAFAKTENPERMRLAMDLLNDYRRAMKGGDDTESQYKVSIVQAREALQRWADV